MRSKPLIALFAIITSSACARLDSIPMSPPHTPETWLASQPWVEFTVASHRFLLVQPSTSIIVFALSILSLVIGARLLRDQGGQLARFWWGAGLVLWGVGGLLAGASYEAFSYAIKCEGRATCVWTSWWEVVYLILTAWSINAMMIGEAHSCAERRWLPTIGFGASVGALAYTSVVLAGALIPIRLLVSFELLILVSAPAIAVCIGLRARRWRRSRSRADLALLGTWLWLVLTTGAYYAYLVLDIPSALWARGIWFTENDVLHVGLIAWMFSIARVIAPRLKDVARE